MRFYWKVTVIASMLLSSCISHHSSFSVLSVEGGRIEITSDLDKSPDTAALKIWKHYSDSVKAVMTPVVGYSEKAMVASYPESLLGNLIADIMLDASDNYGSTGADMALLNLGAIRNSLPKGEITYGDICRVLSFENRYCIVSLNGRQLLELFQVILNQESMAVSGVRLVGSEQHELVEATIKGKPVETDAIYRIATIDYLAEGNSDMTVMKQAIDKYYPEGVWLRDLFADYIRKVEAEGKMLTSRPDGRITVKHGE